MKIERHLTGKWVIQKALFNYKIMVEVKLGGGFSGAPVKYIWKKANKMDIAELGIYNIQN